MHHTEEVLICNSDLITLSSKITERNFVFFYLALITSKLCAKYIRSINVNLNQQAFPKINTLKSFPIPEFDSNSELPSLVVSILSKKEDINKLSTKFENTIKRKFDINKLLNKFQYWYSFTYTDFLKELKKKKIKLSLSEEAEWEEYFEAEKAKAQALQSEIDKIDREIDQMVYELYGSTEEEIAIVENA